MAPFVVDNKVQVFADVFLMDGSKKCQDAKVCLEDEGDVCHPLDIELRAKNQMKSVFNASVWMLPFLIVVLSWLVLAKAEEYAETASTL